MLLSWPLNTSLLLPLLVFGLLFLLFYDYLDLFVNFNAQDAPAVEKKDEGEEEEEVEPKVVDESKKTAKKRATRKEKDDDDEQAYTFFG